MKRLLALFTLSFVILALSACQRVEEVTVTISGTIDDFHYEIEPEGPIRSGDEVALTLVSYDEAYAFLHWFDVDSDTILSENETVTFTVDEDKEVRAVFEKIPPDTYHEVNLASNLERAEFNLPAENEVLAGEELELSVADPEDYYPFLHWEDAAGGIVSEAETFTLTVDKAYALTAVFDTDYVMSHEVTLDSNLERAEFNLPKAQEVFDGEEIAISATDPEAYYPFLHWEDEDGQIISEDATFTLTVEKPYELTAVFDTDYVATYAVTLTSNLSRAEFNLPEENDVLDGEVLAIAATDPEAYYPFLHWEDKDGNIISEEAAFDFTVSGDAALRAVFDLDYETFALTLSSNLPRAEFNLPRNTEHEAGEELVVSVEDPEGTAPFLRWEDGDGQIVSEEESFSLTLTKAMELEAVYDTNEYTVSFSSNLPFAILPDTEQTIEAGKMIEHTVSDPSGHYTFLRWEDGEGAILTTDETLSVRILEDGAFHAVYEIDEDEGDHTVSLETNIDGAHPSILPLRVYYEDGQDVTIAAPEIPGYRFEHWEDAEVNLGFTTYADHIFAIRRNRSFRAVYIEEDRYQLYLNTNLDEADITRSSDGPYEGGETVTLTTEAPDEYVFLHWYDYFNDKMLSADESYTHTIDASRHIVAVYGAFEDPSLAYFTGFEDAIKTSYDDGDNIIQTGGKELILEDTLVGSLSGDRRVGTKSARMRGYIQTNFAVEGLTSIEFMYATAGFSGDSSTALIVKVSVDPDDQNGWVTVSDTVMTESSLQTFYLELDYDELPFKKGAPLYVRITTADAFTANRVNIDDIRFEQAAITTFDIPQDALSQEVYFPNNSERLDMTLDLGMYYSYGDPWEAAGCTVTDTLTGEPVDCFIYGELDTDRLGEQTLIYYAIDEEGRYVSETITKAVFRDASLLEMDFSDIADGYYDGLEGLYGDDLREALAQILRTAVTYQSYGDARYILQETDADPDNPGNVILIYTRWSVAASWDGGETWNREHVWPNRRFPGDRESNLGSDLHNLAPADPGENSSRGFKYFTDTTTGSTYAPPDEVKGNVARMMFYMDVMYEELTLVSGFANPDNYEMGDLDYLLRWHLFDEVSDFELNRNEIISSYQGNRNPFIDIPGLVELLWFDHPALIP